MVRLSPLQVIFLEIHYSLVIKISLLFLLKYYVCKYESIFYFVEFW